MKNDREFWNQQHGHGHHHHGPNETLVELASMLPPGAALDVGCGAGRDSHWLAERGWKVTGVDLSDVAIARARELDARVNWEVVDATSWSPPRERFDLVTSHFMHVSPELRVKLFREMASAVKGGGRLLFVSHHHSDHHTAIGRPKLAELFFMADEVNAVLDPSQWNVEFSGTRPRSERGIAIHDTVLLARRLP